MPLRAAGLVCLVCLGCHAIVPTAPRELGTRAATASPPAATAQVNEAPPTGRMEAALAPEKAPIPLSHLSRATACLAEGDDQQACIHLGRYVAQQPEQRNVRYFYAELLFKLGLLDEAREQFEQTIAWCQEEVHADVRHFIHCHGRLLTLAETAGDEYESLLQRGLGLYWLARARALLGEPDGELPVEAILCKAAGLLSAAHAICPDEARPCWYLHEVWRQLAQRQPARRWLQEAQAAAPFSYLTPAEQRCLVLATTYEDALNRP